MLARVNDLNSFLAPRVNDLALQKKLALDILSFRHHLDMEEEWNEGPLLPYGQFPPNGLFGTPRHLPNSNITPPPPPYMNGRGLSEPRSQSGRKENNSPHPPGLKRKRVMKEDGSSENKWVLDAENNNEVLRDISSTSGDHRPLYSCENCGKSYLWKQGLNTHKRLHCGKEPRFQCPHCPKKCYQRGNLESHIRNVHAINPTTGECIQTKSGGTLNSSSAHNGLNSLNLSHHNASSTTSPLSQSFSPQPVGNLSHLLSQHASFLSPNGGSLPQGDFIKNNSGFLSPRSNSSQTPGRSSPSSFSRGPNSSPMGPHSSTLRPSSNPSGVDSACDRTPSPEHSVHEPFNLSKHFGGTTASVVATGH